MLHPRTHAIFLYLGVFGASFGGLALTAALLGDREGRLWWPLSRLGSKGMLDVCGVTSFRVEGAEWLDGVRPAVVMANHESLFDPAALMVASREPLRFVVKQEVSTFPVFGRALRAMGHVFVDRSGGGGLEDAARAIAGGRTVLVFPEGTRAESEDLLPFKTGGFRLAIRSGAPILPVGIGGARNILPKRGGFQRPGAVALVFGPPVLTHDLTERDLPTLVARARREIETLRERARELARDAAT